MQIHRIKSFYIFLLISILLNLTTQLQNVGPALLYTTAKDIRFANMNMSKPSKGSIIVKDSGDGIVAMDFYYKGSRVCWTDRFLEAIQCVQYNATQSREKVTVQNEGVISPDGLACDWLTGKLYWTDGETNRVEVVTIDGEHRKVLFWDEIDQPRGIALAPLDGLMFWTDWGEDPKIERASMDGNPSSRKVIVSENIYWPNDISIDHVTKQLYWCDGKLKFIEVMDFDGRNRKPVIFDKDIYPYALSIFLDKVYWTDFTTLSIHVADRKNGVGMKEMIHGDYTPLDLAVWDRSRQPSKQTPCDTNNGGCSHLCLLSSDAPGFSCACPTGVKLLNSTTCAQGVQELLLVVQRTDISRISLDSPDHTNFVIPLNKVKHAMNIDYDPVDGYFYWTDDEARGIRRAKLDGSGQEDFITAEVEHPDGVAIDWIARNLYWTDTGTDRIEVAKLSGSVRKVLINSDLIEPRAIAVAPEHGYLFWSDWYEKRPRIERTNLDGSGRVIIVKDAIGWPNGITLDLENSKLYWCDAKTDRIEMINMDGTKRREILSDISPHAFGLSLLGDYLYWTDWQKRSVDRIHKITGDERQVIADELPNIMGVKAISSGQSLGWNPCKDNNGKCSHLCLNKPGNNYVCACQIGYELAADERTCVVQESFLLFSRKENIGRVSIENSGIDAIIPISGVKDVSALDFDIRDNRIYWTDVKTKAITRAFINGSQVERIIEFGLHSPEGLAVDWVSQNIYWTDMGSKRIELARLNGSSRKVLLWHNINDPRSLALDPREGYMYWSDWSDLDGDGSIQRAGMDGSMQSIFLNKIGRAKGLTIDYVERRIYWTLFLQNSGAIESCDLKSNKRITLVSIDIERPFALTLYKDHVYWTDWNKGTIERANKTTGLNRSVVHYRLEHITDLLVFHESRQNGSNQCAFNNGGCSHLCLARPKPLERACACPTHYVLKNNNCEAPTSFLMFSQKNAINRLILDTVDCPDVPLPIHGLKNVRAIEYDPVSMVVYWVDGGRTQSIRWSEVEGSNNGILVGGVGGVQYVYDLALDPYNRLIYWSDHSADIINATWLDSGASLGTIVKNNENEKPRNIALHPEKGYLFWTDIGGTGRVMRARMDGQKRIVIAADLPNLASLAVDRVEHGVYFVYSNKIDRTDLNGNKRQTIVSGDISQVVSLVVSGHFIYWAEKDQQLIERANKHTGEDKLVIMSRVYNLSDLVAILTPTPRELKAHPCTHDKGERHCSHVCVVNNDRRECGCPPGLVLSDEKVCSALPACGMDHFICGSPSADCIPAAWRCDGQVDCPDESDELNCPECTPDQFRCNSGPCISRDKVCDGIAQCSDGADEAHCCGLEMTNLLKFQCATTPHCIPMSTVCDGFRHCPDGSDETAVACQSAAQQKLEDDALNSSVIFAILFLVVLFIVVVFMIIFKLKKKFTEPAPISCDDSVAAPLSPKPMRNGNGNSLRMSNLNQGSSSGHSESLLRYPLNPPPSPSSTVQRQDYRCPRYRPPPPTPCSTDVCDESDSNYRENDPFPPPPTPRSHSSDPPSPSSSTYFPPPPSPINR